MGGSCSRNAKLQVVRYRRVLSKGILISIELFLGSHLPSYCKVKFSSSSDCSIFLIFMFQELDVKPSSYDLKLRLYEHWLDTYKSSGGTDFHSSRQRFFFSLCESFYFYFFGCCTYMVLPSHGFRYIATYHRRLSGPPLSKCSFYGIRNEYFINIF